MREVCAQSSPHSGVPLALSLPAGVVQAIAAAVADQLEQRGALTTTPTSPWLSSTEAASYLRCSKQRLWDLTSQRKLRVAKDGSRSLYRREWLDAYLAGDPS